MNSSLTFVCEFNIQWSRHVKASCWRTCCCVQSLPPSGSSRSSRFCVSESWHSDAWVTREGGDTFRWWTSSDRNGERRLALQEKRGWEGKKEPLCRKTSVWQAACVQLHQQLNAAISRGGRRRRVIVTLVFSWELLLCTFQPNNHKALGWIVIVNQFSQSTWFRW